MRVHHMEVGKKFTYRNWENAYQWKEMNAAFQIKHFYHKVDQTNSAK